MTILRMITRKMLNSRWLVGSWLIGMLITVSLVSSIPIYTSGVLERLLIKDIESVQSTSQLYPGGLFEVLTFQSPSLRKKIDPKLVYPLERQFNSSVTNYVGLPKLAGYTELDSLSLSYSAPGATSTSNTNDQYLTLTAMTDLEKHIHLVGGRLPADHPVNGIYEVLAPVTTVQQMDLGVGQLLSVTPANGSTNKSMTVKIVGVFQAESGYNLYWRTGLDGYAQNLMMPDSLFRKTFVDGPYHWMQYMNLYSAFDYHKVTIASIPTLTNVVNVVQSDGWAVLGQGQALGDFPLAEPLPAYLDKNHQLTLMVWSLDVPVLIMLVFYMFMVSRLIVDRERTEIAVLRSRGASRWQIFVSYAIEVTILAAIAFVLGPLIGLGLTELLGASSGFLEFVQRSALPVHLSQTVYLYALWSALACIVMVLVPVLLATRENIVSHKQQAARGVGQAVWHRYFIDILLLLVSAYGWYTIQKGKHELFSTGLDINNGLQIDPLSFFVPALFVLGVGLFCLRLYPLLVKLVYWVGRHHFPPSSYVALNQVGRAPKQYHFLMIFLVMTIAVGTFSASAARTINTNLEQQIEYNNGADITLSERWQNDATFGAGGTSSNKPVHYQEPPFYRYPALPGVQHAARVFTQDHVAVTATGSGQSSSETELMAIDPPDFGLTAWFQPSLLPYHWWGYLNLLSSNPQACLISESLAKMLNIQPGDQISLGWQDAPSTKFTVYGIIGYWPAWNPYDTTLHDSNTNEPASLVVANLPYVQNSMAVQPYSVWLKLKPGGTSEQVYSAFEKEQIPVMSLTNTRQQIVQLKTGPFVLCLNGSLTLGFIIAMAVTFLGFLLYWLLTLGARRLQFGVFRAMGMSLRRLVFMLVWEQLLTSGVACVLGGVVGVATSQLFVTQFQLYFSAVDQVPPFQVVYQGMDGVRMYAFVVFMLLVGVGIIWWLLSRLRIHQAVKLGED